MSNLPSTTNLPAADSDVSAGAPASELQGDSLEKLREMLSDPQQTALAALGEGQSIARAATLAGVNRSTVHRWIKSDATFLAAYNAWQQEICESAHARLVRCTDDAVECLTAAVRSNPNLAFRLVQALGILHSPAGGNTSPRLLARQLRLQEQEQELTLNRRELKHRLDKAGVPEKQQRRFLAGLRQAAQARKAVKAQTQIDAADPDATYHEQSEAFNQNLGRLIDLG